MSFCSYKQCKHHQMTLSAMIGSRRGHSIAPSRQLGVCLLGNVKSCAWEGKILSAFYRRHCDVTRATPARSFYYSGAQSGGYRIVV